MEGGEAEEKEVLMENIEGPVVLWIIIIAIGFALLAIPNFFSLGKNIDLLESKIGYFFSFSPGYVLVPLIIGVLIGNKSGRGSTNVKNAIKRGSLNAAYAFLVYGIAISVIYELSTYLAPLANYYGINEFIIKNIIISGFIVVVISIISSALSFSRGS
ncbi:MAG: hypothetical protein QXL16_01540 [Candidatus Micrarchaeaceae archaeon]